MPMPEVAPLGARVAPGVRRKPSQSTIARGLLDLLLRGDADERLAGEHGERRLVRAARSCGGARRAGRCRARGR